MLHRRLALLLCGLPLCAGMLLIFTTLQQSIAAEAAAGWGTTSGVVEVGMSHATLGLFYTHGSSEVEVRDRVNRFRYRYSVNGQSYSSQRVGFNSIELITLYQMGDKVVVYYDPHNPANAVLVTGIGLAQLMAYAVAFGLIGAAIVLWRRLMSAHEQYNQRLHD